LRFTVEGFGVRNLPGGQRNVRVRDMIANAQAPLRFTVEGFGVRNLPGGQRNVRVRDMIANAQAPLRFTVEGCGIRCRANVAHARQSKPDSGHGFPHGGLRTFLLLLLLHYSQA